MIKHFIIVGMLKVCYEKDNEVFISRINRCTRCTQQSAVFTAARNKVDHVFRITRAAVVVAVAVVLF